MFSFHIDKFRNMQKPYKKIEVNLQYLWCKKHVNFWTKLCKWNVNVKQICRPENGGCRKPVKTM